MASQIPIKLVDGGSGAGTLQEFSTTDTIPVANLPAVSDYGAEPAITGGTSAQFWRGDKVWTNFATTTLAVTLNGLVVTSSTAIASTDTLLVAAGKLQAQITTLSSGKLDATATAAAATKLATARTINGVSFDGTANITVADSTKEPTITAGTTAQYWRGDKTWTSFNTTALACVLTGYASGTNAVLAATDTFLAAFGKIQAQISAKLNATDNAVSATKLATARTINGVSFDGTANVTVADSTKVATSLLGVASGVATLDSNGTVPAAQLPSYVDDVLEVSSYSALPTTGATGKIYVTTDTNSQYRWTGTVYVQLTASPGTTDAVPEGTTNLYFTTARVLATPLTGYAVGSNTALAAADTILAAMAKIQAQLNNKLATTGTAAAATKLATARTINGVSFDGTANITVADGTKEPTITAGTAAQFWRGDKTFADLTAAVQGVLLTGLVTTTNAAIAATDTILAALGKLQAQLANYLPLAGGTLSGALNAAPQVTLASAATVNIGAAAANSVIISGTTTITGFDTIAAGVQRTVTFSGALTLTYSATKMILPGKASYTTAAGDTAIFESLGSGNWRCIQYTKANGTSIASIYNMVTASELSGPYSQSTTSTLKVGTLSCSITTTGNPVQVSYSIVTQKAGTGGNGQLSIRRTNTSLTQAQWVIPQTDQAFNYKQGTFVDTPAAGTWVYEFYWAVESTSDTMSTVTASDGRFTRFISAKEVLS